MCLLGFTILHPRLRYFSGGFLGVVSTSAPSGRGRYPDLLAWSRQTQDEFEHRSGSCTMLGISGNQTWTLLKVRLHWAEITALFRWVVLAAPSQDQSLPRVYPGGNGSAWHGTGLARRRKREHRTVFNNEHLALKEQAARGWFIGTETIDYCAVSQGPFDSIYSFLQIYELPISYKWSPPFLGSWLLASFLSCFFFFFSLRIFLVWNI